MQRASRTGSASIVQTTGLMFGQGAGSIVSRALGHKDEQGSATHATLSVVSAFTFGLTIALVCA